MYQQLFCSDSTETDASGEAAAVRQQGPHCSGYSQTAQDEASKRLVDDLLTEEETHSGTVLTEGRGAGLDEEEICKIIMA